MVTPRDTPAKAASRGRWVISMALILFQAVALLSLASGPLSLQNLEQRNLPATVAVNFADTAVPIVGAVTFHTEQEQMTRNSRELSFLDVAASTGTDKVKGEMCALGKETCNKFPDAKQPKCRVGGHFYHTLYQRWLGEYSHQDADRFQFLEIGFYHGSGFKAYTDFLPRGELHSMEISCIESGPRIEGKWPWGNFAIQSPQYDPLLQDRRLHCGDASDFKFLQETWVNEMKRPDAPPLKVVVDDASHLASHMATSLFYWFPKIAPRGLMFVEDIQPLNEADGFRVHVLPQIMKDLHYCGDPKFKESACFPTLQPLLASIHCELHICVFERNDEPAVEYDEDLAMPPAHALNAKSSLCMFG